MNEISLRNLKDKEQSDVVNTPRSLEACNREGIRPEELLYAPVEEFARPNLPKEIQYMNYEFYEFQRKKLLLIAKKAYSELRAKKKRSRSQTSTKLSRIVTNETQRIREKNLKQMSKLINYKLDTIRYAIEGETAKSNIDINRNSASSSNIKRENPSEKSKPYESTARMSQTSRSGAIINDFTVTAKSFNLKRDAELIEKERNEKEKQLEYERQRNVEIELRRKRADEKLQEHIARAKMLKELDTKKKIQAISKKEEATNNKLRKIFSSRAEMREKKTIEAQEKFSRVVSCRLQFDEYLQGIRDQVVKEENEKIAAHSRNKLKLKQDIKEKFVNKNRQWDMKSKRSRDKIEKNMEEKKEKKLDEIKMKEKKMINRKDYEEKMEDFTRERNKLKEIEKNWNIERVNRKEEFLKNEMLINIRNNNLKVQNIQSVREHMQRLRYDLTIQTESQKNRIDSAIYMMAVQKKLNLSQLQEIINTNSYSPRASQDKLILEKKF